MAALAANSGDESAWVRAENAYALGTLGGETAIQVLKHALHDADTDVRESAVSAFTEIGGAQSAQALAVVLRDADTSLRVEAVEALREIGGETATHLLNAALQDQDNAVDQYRWLSIVRGLNRVPIEPGSLKYAVSGQYRAFCDFRWLPDHPPCSLFVFSALPLQWLFSCNKIYTTKF